MPLPPPGYQRSLADIRCTIIWPLTCVCLTPRRREYCRKFARVLGVIKASFHRSLMNINVSMPPMVMISRLPFIWVYVA